MATTANKVHSPSPPCSCHSCLRAIAQADQRRAEIAAILERFDRLDLNLTTADKLEGEVGQ
jgi:hypothetical protein